MVLIWTHTKDQHTQLSALAGMGALNKRHTVARPKLYTAIAKDDGIRRSNYAAMIRDFKNERVVDHLLVDLLLHITHLQRGVTAFAGERLDVPLNRQILWGALAACRRQLCSGDMSGETPEEIFELILGPIRSGNNFARLLLGNPMLTVFFDDSHIFVARGQEVEDIRVSETQLYEVVIVIAKSVVILMEGDAPTTTEGPGMDSDLCFRR